MAHIIVKDRRSEHERREAEFAKKQLKGHHDRECRDGNRYRSKFPKNLTKQVWEEMIARNGG